MKANRTHVLLDVCTILYSWVARWNLLIPVTHESVPVVTYTEEQEQCVNNKYFRGLLVQLGQCETCCKKNIKLVVSYHLLNGSHNFQVSRIAGVKAKVSFAFLAAGE